MAIDVPGSGPRDAKLVVVGEQPGTVEQRVGKPFIGPAGRVLDECLHAAGIARTDIYVTNVVKTLTSPLHTFCDKPQRGAAFFTDKGRVAVEYLKYELQEVSPNVIVVAGNVALLALTSRWGITKWRGSVVESTLVPPIKVIPIIHPATVLPDKGQYLNRYLIIRDLQIAAREQHYPEILLEPRKAVIKPTYDEVIRHLEYCREAGLKGEVIDYDIEVGLDSQEITCISFTVSPNYAISIPFVSSYDYFPIHQEAHIWKEIASILEDPRLAKRGQNVAFDCHFLLHKRGIRVRGEIHDTMVMQKIANPDLRAGLDTIVSIYTDIPYYKDEGKKWMANKLGGWENFWRYNAMDSMATAASSPGLMKDLAAQGNVETYHRQRKVIPILVYMMERGIRCDVDGMARHAVRLEKELETLQQKLDAVAGCSLNPRSPAQLKDYFYKQKGLKPYKSRKKTKGDGTTVDEEAMKRIKRLGFEEADLILQIRKRSKQLGNYLDVSKVSADGRYRCSYNPVGTETGRLSSSENIFDEGSNLQNWPFDMLTYLVADDGYVYYSMDLSQAENRIVAYVGNVHEMIRCFEEGKDVHSLTASLIFEVPADQIKVMDDQNVFCDLGDGKHTHRFYGKKSNHGLNYDLGYRNFALILELPEAQGKWLVDKYHGAYPGIRANYHPLVKAMLRKNRMVTNLMGRNRLFLDKLEDHTFKAAYAQIPQSSVADKMNEHGLEHMYYDPTGLHKPAEILNQIHDSMGFQLPLSIGWERHAEIILDLKRSLEIPYTWHDRSFVVPADLTIGYCMNKKLSKDLKSKKIPDSATALASKLKDAWEQLQEEKNHVEPELEYDA